MRVSAPPYIGTALLALVACGPSVDLDGSPGAEAGLGTSPGAPGTSGDNGNALETTDSGQAKLDIAAAFDVGAPPPPLPPGMCPPDCQLQLSRDWIFNGPPSDRVDPQSEIAVVDAGDGTTIVADQREGAITLARLDASGQQLWTAPLALPCDPCRLSNIALHPTSTDLLIAGYGADVMGMPIAVLARVEREDHTVVWSVDSPLVDGLRVTPRAGSVAVVHETLIVQPVVHAAPRPDLEAIELNLHDADSGSLILSQPIASAPPPASPWVPRAASFDQLVVVAYAGPDTQSQGQFTWLDPLSGDVSLTAIRTDPIAGLVSSEQRVISIGRASGGRAPMLSVRSATLAEPAEWEVYEDSEFDFHEPSAIVADQLGHAHAAVQLTGARPSTVQLWRWTETGDLVWRVSLPLVTDPAGTPIALDVRDDTSLILGSFSEGGVHVERRTPSCQCG